MSNRENTTTLPLGCQAACPRRAGHGVYPVIFNEQGRVAVAAAKVQRQMARVVVQKGVAVDAPAAKPTPVATRPIPRTSPGDADRCRYSDNTARPVSRAGTQYGCRSPPAAISLVKVSYRHQVPSPVRAYTSIDNAFPRFSVSRRRQASRGISISRRAAEDFHRCPLK